MLLSMSISSRNGADIPLLNALFTSASATCVLALSCTTQFSCFGQGVILLLIQIGGLGLRTAFQFYLYRTALFVFRIQH